MKKPRIQPALASLTLAEREQLADWLRHDHYAVVLERVKKPRPEGFNLSISDKPLRTFWLKIGLLDAINARLPADKKISLELFESLATRDIYFLSSLDSKKLEEAHQAILDTSADLATSGESTPAQLATLQRLIDFPVRAEIRAAREERDQAKEERAEAKAQREEAMHAHKIAYDNARLEIAKQTLALRTAKASTNSAHSTQHSALPESDHLGPLARNWEEVRARAQAAFGITPEESARRAELRRTWKPPELTEPQPTVAVDETIPVQQLADVTQADSLNLNPNLSTGGTSRAGSANQLSVLSSGSPTSTSRDDVDHHHAAGAVQNSTLNPVNRVNPVKTRALNSQLSTLNHAPEQPSPLPPVSPVKTKTSEPLNLIDLLKSITVPNPVNPVNPVKTPPLNAQHSTLNDNKTPSALNPVSDKNEKLTT
jgi:hypothetical protein